MTYEYDRDTRISALGDGLHGAHLAPGWVVGGGVNGGYLLAIIGKAVAAELEARTPERLTRTRSRSARTSSAPRPRARRTSRPR
jgi:hypothetical protein